MGHAASSSSHCVFSFSLLLPCSFFFALQLFALRFSLPRFVVVSFVQCNKFHLTANEGTRHPPTATDGLPLPLSFALSCSLLLLLLRLVAAAFSSCGLRFVVCYLFLFSMRSLLFALPIMRCTHRQAPTHTHRHRHNYNCMFVYSQLHLHASWPVCLFSNLCLSICSRLSLLLLSFHFVCLNARVVVFIVVTPLCSASLVSAN